MIHITFPFVVAGLLAMTAAFADDLADLKAYQYGADQSRLLAIERQTEAAMAAPASQRKMARRLLSVLTDPQATLAAKQHAGILLRLCGTEAEVPVLASLLGKGEVGQFAREALERIPAQAAGKALRDALGTLHGPALVGVIHSVANRKDREAVGALVTLTRAGDANIAATAAHALGRIGGLDAGARLKELAASGKDAAAAEAYLSCAMILMDAGDKTAAGEIFDRLADRRYPATVRRGAMTGKLLLAADARPLLAPWLDGNDPDAIFVAQNRLVNQPTAWLLAACQGKPLDKAIFFAEVLAERGEKGAIPLLMEAARQKGDQALRVRGIMAMGGVADRECVLLLVDALDDNSVIARAALTALSVLPGTVVDAPALEALQKSKGQQQARLIDLLVARRMTAAVVPLLEMAKADGGDDSDKALSALVALGDQTTLAKLVELLRGVAEGQYRDRLETVYRDIARKYADDVDPVLAEMKDHASTIALLPVLGRVGGDAARRKVNEALSSKNSEVKAAGVRALCNWPDASVAEQLGRLAESEKESAVRVRALRAYIRVVSIKSERPTADTLAMLQKAYGMAQRPEEKQLAVERAKMARHIHTLRWLVSLLEEEAVREAACGAIVELAHHRELRNPNRDEFAKALQKVIAISKDAETVRRAKGYLVGV